MATPLRLLLVEDCDDDAVLLLRELRRGGYDVDCHRVDTPEAYRAALAAGPWDLIIADYSLPRFSGPEAMALLKQSGMDLPFLVVSGRVGEETAAAMMRSGANDYFIKGNLVRLAAAVARELHEASERCRRRQVEQTLHDTERQLYAAQKIQEHFLPSRPPQVAGLDVAGAMYPAEFIAGDYFDFLPINEHSLGLVVGDVSGHGFHSALLMVSTYTLVHVLAPQHADIPTIMSLLNRFLCAETESQFVTFLLARLDRRSGVLTYANAGHPAGYVLNNSGAVKAQLDSNAVALGILPNTEYPLGKSVTLEPGDIVILFTDGIPETFSPAGELFGTDRMLDLIRAQRCRPASEILDQLHSALIAFRGPLPRSDDLTAILVKVE